MPETACRYLHRGSRDSIYTDVSGRSTGILVICVMRDSEVRNPPDHHEHFPANHWLPHKVTQYEIHSLPLRLELIPHHHNLHERIVEINVRSTQVDNLYTDQVCG